MITRAHWFGDRAVSVSLDDDLRREEVAIRLAEAFPHLLVRRGMASVLVESEVPDPALLPAVEAVLATMPAGRAAAPAPVRRTVTIGVRYDGPDLEEVAAGFGCSAASLVAAHQQQEWRVAMMGFAPGFGYLLPEGEHVLPWSEIPRRSRPREQVDAGAVAVAAGMSAVYPQAMPGGWSLIGRTSVRLFDPERPSGPALLAPGDLVVFHTEGA